MKRKFGQTSVEEHPKGSGKYRTRARIDGKRVLLISGVTEAEAEEASAAFIRTRNATSLRQGVTLADFGAGFLERRERAGVRGIRMDRSRWDVHVAGDPIGALPVSSLDRRDVVEWLDRRSGVAYRTRLRVLGLLTVALSEAVDRELLAANPAQGVRVHRAAAATHTDDLDGILVPAEQRALVAATPAEWRAVVVFALCTGLRQAEQWWLRWSDVLADRIVVRRSSRGLPPKGGKPREVFLLPAARLALQGLPRDGEHVFRSTRGHRLAEAKAPRGWKSWLAAAGIQRRVRWHDLRHTCATSLLAGWWGRKWTLDEVCRLLGHSSVTVTERYARKLGETQRDAVLATPMLGFDLVPAGTGFCGNMALLSNGISKDSAFVKHRSSVQIRQSAPSETAENCSGSRRDAEQGAGDDWDQVGTKRDPEPASVELAFIEALTEHAERAEAADLLGGPGRGAR